ncbi:hypothetical protein KY284_028742 [Solanum tuberosum]|nr:hypothetical protein KY284_028742 [Solanum tuberosum]
MPRSGKEITPAIDLMLFHLSRPNRDHQKWHKSHLDSIPLIYLLRPNQGRTLQNKAFSFGARRDRCLHPTHNISGCESPSALANDRKESALLKERLEQRITELYAALAPRSYSITFFLWSGVARPERSVKESKGKKNKKCSYLRLTASVYRTIFSVHFVTLSINRRGIWFNPGPQALDLYLQGAFHSPFPPFLLNARDGKAKIIS